MTDASGGRKTLRGGRKTEHAQDAPFHLNFYEGPDGFTSCYLVPGQPEKVKDPSPVLIASVRTGILHNIPGLFDDFKVMMVKVVTQAVIETTGQSPVGWEAVETPYPDGRGERGERGGSNGKNGKSNGKSKGVKGDSMK